MNKHAKILLAVVVAIAICIFGSVSYSIQLAAKKKAEFNRYTLEKGIAAAKGAREAKQELLKIYKARNEVDYLDGDIFLEEQKLRDLDLRIANMEEELAKMSK